MALVLLIEDEAMLRGSMARGLARLPGVEVAEAGSLEEALAVLDTTPPRLVLSDLDLPGRSGIELLGELGRRGLRVPVVFISAYLKAYGTQIPPHADVEVREKPVSLEELRQLVVARLGEPKIAGEASPFTATDYLQLASLGRHSVVIEVTDEAGRAGRIVLAAGEAWSAEDADGQGDEAFRRMALARARGVKCQTLRGELGPRNLLIGWEQLLLDAARMEDEAGRPAPAEAASPEEPPPPTRSFDAVWEAGVVALRAKDYPAALAAFLEAKVLKPGDAWVAVNLDRLRRMGYDAEENK